MKLALHWLPAVSALCAALLVSCGKTDQAKSSKKDDALARPVRVARAELRPMTRAITVTGTLAAQEWSTLSAKVSGRLQTLAVDIGSVVRAGDLLAQVEPRDYELRVQQADAALAQARAALGLPLESKDESVIVEQISSVKQAKAVLDEATKNRERVIDLGKTGVASQAELDTVESTYRVARARYDTALEDGRTRVAALAQRRAEYEIAAKQLQDASVRAPFDGAVQTRPASVGEYVAAGVPIVTLIKTDPLRLRLEVPERESITVRAGQAVRLNVEGDTNVYTGQIVRLSPAITEQSRMLLVEADVPKRGSLRPGLFARADVVVNEREDAVCVPANVLIVFAGIEKVVLVQDGKALEKTVTTGRHDAGWVEIVSGLAAGEAVVVDPGGLRTGQPVTVGGPAETRPASKAAGKPGR
jgi:RND family efflux transporter MFP subunit